MIWIRVRFLKKMRNTICASSTERSRTKTMRGNGHFWNLTWVRRAFPGARTARTPAAPAPWSEGCIVRRPEKNLPPHLPLTRRPQSYQLVPLPVRLSAEIFRRPGVLKTSHVGRQWFYVWEDPQSWNLNTAKKKQLVGNFRGEKEGFRRPKKIVLSCPPPSGSVSMSFIRHSSLLASLGWWKWRIAEVKICDFPVFGGRGGKPSGGRAVVSKPDHHLV